MPDPKRKVEVEEEYQRIEQELYEKDLPLEPKYVRNFYTSNVVQRVIALLYSLHEGRPIPIKLTEAGELVAAPAGFAVENYDVQSGSATDDFVEYPFPETCLRVDIFITTNSADIQFSRDGVVYGPTIKVDPGVFYSIDSKIKSFEIKNTVAAQVAEFQLVGWW